MQMHAHNTGKIVCRPLHCAEQASTDTAAEQRRTHGNFGAADLIVEVQRPQQLNQRVLQRPDQEGPPSAKQTST